VKDIAQMIAKGLQRKAITRCSEWATTYRVMGKPFDGPWSFRFFPWLKEMHDSEAEENIGMKAAQMGYTEAMLNICFFYMDIKGLNCLYLLPAADPDASDFSARAFDPALEMSPHLNEMFSDVRNVGHKRAGSANLFVRGTKSRTGLKSIPAALIVFDEVEEMVQENLPLAEERSGGQLEYQKWKISTPRIPDAGIHEMYLGSSEEHFFFPCPSCSKFIELTFPECLEIHATDHQDEAGLAKTRLICPKCKATLDHKAKPDFLAKSEWVKSRVSSKRGFAINRLYSSARKGTPSIIAQEYLLSLINPWKEQEFYNSVLGLPHVIKGSQINDNDINQCLGEYRSRNFTGKLLCLGVDVGSYFHYELTEYDFFEGRTNDINNNSKARCVLQDKTVKITDLDELMDTLPIAFCVIDGNPERRIALEFANRHPGRVRLCFYGRGINSKQIRVAPEDSDPTMTVDRTSWMDIALGRVKKGLISYPVDMSLEGKQHLKASAKIYDYDADGNPVAKYVNGGKPDHYGHARVYSELALPFAVSSGDAQNIEGVL
jgi:hypothetical protein